MNGPPKESGKSLPDGLPSNVDVGDAVFVLALIALMVFDWWVSKAVDFLFGATIIAIQVLLIRILGRMLNVREVDSWLEIFTPSVLGFGARSKK